MSEGSLTQEALNAKIAWAKEQGFEVIRADANTLLLDFDDELTSLQRFEEVLPILQEHFSVVRIERWASKDSHIHGGGHVRITLTEEYPWAVRYALQAALGSDPVREALAVKQMLNGCDEACMLFKPPSAQKKTDDKADDIPW